VVNLKNINILKIGIISASILIVLVSGCISSSTNQTKTFSDGVMSFNYPGDFGNGTFPGNDTNSSSPMQVIGKLENTVPLNVHDIMVYENISGISPTEARDGIVSVVKNMSAGEVLSITTETNPNGVTVEKITYTDEFILGVKTVYSDMFFKINDSVYRITVYGPDTKNKQKINDTTNTIFQSIK
jgi:hypothetical protein